MYKIAVMGAPDAVMGFKALGLDTFPVRGEQDARATLKMLTRPDQKDEYAIIYVEENLAQALEADIARFKDSPRPAIILIPGKDGSLGLGQSALQAAVERAVGANIL
jgi:V/A-type H+-transporting ATPase subunit F